MFDGLGSLIKLRQNADSVTDGHIDDQAKSFPVLESPNLFPFCAFTTIFFFLRGQYLDLECASKYLTTQICARHEKEQGIFSRHYPDLLRADSSLGDPRLGRLWASGRCLLPVLKEGMEYRVKLTD